MHDPRVHAKPPGLPDRGQEWKALDRFIERSPRLAVCYGPRRVGRSFLLDAFLPGHRGVFATRPYAACLATSWMTSFVLWVLSSM
jgi:hypothetical protein